MHPSTTTRGRRSAALAALVGAVAVVALGAADDARAAYTANVRAGTLEIVGNKADDALVLVAGGTSLVLDVGGDGTADFTFDPTTFTSIEVDAGAGDDRISVVGSLLDESLTIHGGDGNDTIGGGNGADVLVAGDGNDIVDGQQGADVAQLGRGDDRFQWDPGDGSDTIDAGSGNDVLDFNGSGANENVRVAANGQRVRFTRDVGTIELDLAGIERVGYGAFGGADTVVVDDLAGTGVASVDVDLGAIGGAGDGQVDTVVAHGTNGPDVVGVDSAAGPTAVRGLAALVTVAGSEAAFDIVGVATLAGADTITAGVGLSGPLSVDVDGGDDADVARFTGTASADDIQVVANGAEVSTVAPASSRLDAIAVESLVVLALAGDDTVTGVGNVGALTSVTMDGGAGDDTLRGSNGSDLLLGGNGDDLVDGNQGDDRAVLGGGNDRFQWDPGDGSDTVEGEAGKDAIDFFGSAANESLAISANAGTVRLTRDIAAIELGFAGIEELAVRTFGGSDTVVVDDLAGTDLEAVAVDLALFGGGGDALADTVVVNGTAGKDAVEIGRAGAEAIVAGLSAQVRIAGGEGASDTLRIQTLAGDDDVTFAESVSDLVTPVVDLGADD